jgi:superfamily II DNA or RNA helicase
MLPFTRKDLETWSGPQVFAEATRMLEGGRVEEARLHEGVVTGTISATPRSIRTALRLQAMGRHPDNDCPCRDNRERGMICAHVIALCLDLLRIENDPERKARREEERRRAERLSRVSESAYLKRAALGTPRTVAASLVVRLPEGLPTPGAKEIPTQVLLAVGGQEVPLERARRDATYGLSRQDENLLFVLEDVCEGPARGDLRLSRRDFLSVLALLAGKPLLGPAGREYAVHATPMEPRLLVELDRENGELILLLDIELPFRKATDRPVYGVAGKQGWVEAAGHFWPLRRTLPEFLHPLYEQPMIIARPAVPQFLRVEFQALRQFVTVETELTPELFSFTPAPPRFRLEARGSPVSLSATLYACYGELRLIAGKPDSRGEFAIPDPQDLLAYQVRNLEEEQRALRRLRDFDLGGETGDTLHAQLGKARILRFLGTLVPGLRRLGWEVEVSGRVTELEAQCDQATPVVAVTPGGGENGWFDVAFQYETGRGDSLDPAEVARALRMGESHVERNGRIVLFDAEAIQSLGRVFADCSSREGASAGAFRLSAVHGAYVQSSLAALDGVDVEAPGDWVRAADRQNRGVKPEPIDLGPLEGVLRDYQRQGVSWLRGLEASGAGGILADEMGLGKTLQTLAWLQLARLSPAARGKPSLIICPTSLVENWLDEARKFTPHLRFLNLTGGDRQSRLAALDEADVGVTSYAILRRDLAATAGREYAAVVLDEAQHIKNRSTQNAQAVKTLAAHHRLVLTGTPVENGVSDLWSIMDFLLPGYLGPHDHFRAHFEAPIQAGGELAVEAQGRLRRKLQPFLLRRLKREVAKDLPPKIERVASCALSADQAVVYKELLKASQDKIGDLVGAQGFNRARMEILKTLLRLRQVCCHLELLKLPHLKSRAPSAKQELFMELLQEAMDGGHRVLVFSQFTSMLKILRRDLEEAGIRLCYLDGATVNRMEEVRRFNADAGIPLFLISLKAGGTGLNLTGADMVVHYDPWWNPAVENQATDRAYRIGQKRTVYSVKLITKDTVEERVLALQRRKQKVIDATLGEESAFLETLSWEDVKDLLEM